MQSEAMHSRPVHMLHVGKTGGSAVKSVLRQHMNPPGYRLHLHSHDVNLRDIPIGEKAFFFLRDPISRFVSGFRSRQRKGMPRNFNEWNELETMIFQTFSTPNQLACALADVNSADHAIARKALSGVSHLASYFHWFGGIDYLNSRIQDIFFIGFQESLADDFIRLKQLFGLPDSLALPDDDVMAHRSPKGQDNAIDDVGLAALSKWYAGDIQFVEHCRKLSHIVGQENAKRAVRPAVSWRFS